TKSWPRSPRPAGRSFSRPGGTSAIDSAAGGRFDCQVTIAAPEPAARGTRSARWLAVPLGAFALVSLTVGLFARERFDPNKGYFQLFFSDTLHLRACFATAAVILGLCQLFTAAWIFRKLPWPRPDWIPALHRWTRRLPLARTPSVTHPRRVQTRSSA